MKNLDESILRGKQMERNSLGVLMSDTAKMSTYFEETPSKKNPMLNKILAAQANLSCCFFCDYAFF